jgi:hypothetical protein
MNVIVSKKGTKEIAHFVRDAVMGPDGSIRGSNLRIHGLNPGCFDVFWTEDDVVDEVTTRTTPRGFKIPIRVYHGDGKKMTLSATPPESPAKKLRARVDTAKSLDDMRAILSDVISIMEDR